MLWLLPLAVLARPRWRDQLIWQAGEVFYFCTVWWYLGGFLNPAGGGEVGFYWVGIAVRVACELYLVVLVVRDMFRPGRDPARAVPGKAPSAVDPGHQVTAINHTTAAPVPVGSADNAGPALASPSA
ncbi:hypothetical protein [Nocardioides sp. TF02-7]|uniref:hypothetical protein n=1 Tax=Nocardioides sp. TF02-7 TaxID=2917724 RepID=UPI001F061B23|nr:hypothetical protein [Nocardioides sp. TF02-7]UMG94203.1 hypothetical protein MF408_09355 [Nocardioides sp. TF02-7]